MRKSRQKSLVDPKDRNFNDLLSVIGMIPKSIS